MIERVALFHQGHGILCCALRNSITEFAKDAALACPKHLHLVAARQPRRMPKTDLSVFSSRPRKRLEVAHPPPSLGISWGDAARQRLPASMAATSLPLGQNGVLQADVARLH